MNISTSEKEENVVLSQEEIPDCEWHTKDPLTGEIFFLSKGVLYSKFPSKDTKRINDILTSELTSENNLNFQKNVYLYKLNSLVCTNNNLDKEMNKSDFCQQK